MGRGRRLKHERSAEPMRRCIGCRTQRPAREMIRIAALAGASVVDEKRVLPGRGAWICKIQRCAEVASKGRQASRALKGKAAEPSSAELMRWINAALPLTPDPASK
jgi:predicted RNA-binding protein YlxR (DUF448 family)